MRTLSLGQLAPSGPALTLEEIQRAVCRNTQRPTAGGTSPFYYTISDTDFQPGIKHTISPGIAETYTKVCGKGKRIMDIEINGVEYVYDLDVFQRAGCDSALASLGERLCP